jgi:hypothetical protein
MRKSTLKKWLDRKKEMVPVDTVAAAIHEAGHAVADELIREGVEYVEIHDNKMVEEETFHEGKRYSHGISTGHTASKARPMNNQEDLEKECITTWAGPIAERLFTGKDFDGEDGDATYLSRLLFSGIIEEVSGKIVLLLPKDEATALLNKSAKLADALIRASWPAVTEIAQAIVVNQRISGDEVKQIVDKHGRERMLESLDKPTENERGADLKES